MSYYVKQGEDEKGPYSLEQLRASLEEKALQGTTRVREEGSDVWVRLDSVVLPKRSRSSAAAADVLDQVRQAKRQKADRDVMIGGIVCLAGILVTALSYSGASESGGKYIFAWGAIIFGGMQLIRGLANRGG